MNSAMKVQNRSKVGDAIHANALSKFIQPDYALWSVFIGPTFM